MLGLLKQALEEGHLKIHAHKSNQIDIIISDSAKTPIFYESTSLRILPVECVYVVTGILIIPLDTNACRFVNNTSLCS